MGWLALFKGARAIDTDAVLADLGSDFALARPELYFKLYANGAPTHRYIDAALALRASLCWPGSYADTIYGRLTFPRRALT